jgi:hypothetical protein
LLSSAGWCTPRADEIGDKFSSLFSVPGRKLLEFSLR